MLPRSFNQLKSSFGAEAAEVPLRLFGQPESSDDADGWTGAGGNGSDVPPRLFNQLKSSCGVEG